MHHRLKGSPVIGVLLFYFCCVLWHRASSLCPGRCSCDDSTLIVHCEEASLDFVPITLNPGLKELHLSKNHIKSIKASIMVYHELHYLDMSHNQLVALDGQTFQKQNRLKFLLLQRNMISSLHNESFLGLESLELLRLNENILEEIPPMVFVHLHQLKNLDLSQNRISKIDDLAFYGLQSLQTLLLRDNKLKYVPKQAFEKVKSLVKLDLGLNFLLEIPENAFSPLNNLEDLSLDSCRIRIVRPGAFKWLSALLVLRLNDNDLSDVPSRALFDVIRLEELHIGQNQFATLKSMSFQRLRYLKTLHIDGARYLERIQPKAFVENVNLEEVHFHHNAKLKVVERGAFEGLANLRRVSLRGNAFETFNHNILPWDDLVYVDVRDNPLVCNCSIIWLWTLLRTKNFSRDIETDASIDTEIDQVACAEPQQLRGQRVKDLASDDFDCSDVRTRRQIMIGLIIASALVLTLIVSLGVRFRERIAGVLKSKWNGGRKEPQYQKTHGEEEAQAFPPAQQPIKMIPVNEL